MPINANTAIETVAFVVLESSSAVSSLLEPSPLSEPSEPSLAPAVELGVADTEDEFTVEVGLASTVLSPTSTMKYVAAAIWLLVESM